MMTTPHQAGDPATTALPRARALASAIGETAAFRTFEAAQAALDADADLIEMLTAFQIKEQELRQSQAWGGAAPDEVQALEREWEALSSHPILAAHFAAREQLIGLLRELTAAISEGVGLDYGAACAPAGGCC